MFDCHFSFYHKVILQFFLSFMLPIYVKSFINFLFNNLIKLIFIKFLGIEIIDALIIKINKNTRSYNLQQIISTFF